MKKLKILTVIERTSWDGAKEQTYLFVREMSKYHDIELAINENNLKMAEQTKPFARVHFFEKYARLPLQFNPANYRRLLKIINAHDYDVIIAQSSLAAQYLRLISPWMRKRPPVVAVKRGNTALDALSKHLKYSIADDIVFVSRHVKENSEKNRNKHQRLHVIESGVDLSKFFPGTESITDTRNKIGVPLTDKIYINVANWDPNRKRQPMILDAFAKLQRKDCHLLLVGAGTDSPEVTAMLSQMNIADRVHCLGFREDVPDLLRTSDFFVLSSSHEGIAGSLLQAMACGLPVLSTYAGGIQDYLHDGINGFGTEVNDITGFQAKFSSLPELPKETLNSLSLQAIDTAQKYSLDHNIQQWLTLLEDTFERNLKHTR